MWILDGHICQSKAYKHVHRHRFSHHKSRCDVRWGTTNDGHQRKLRITSLLRILFARHAHLRATNPSTLRAPMQGTVSSALLACTSPILAHMRANFVWQEGLGYARLAFPCAKHANQDSQRHPSAVQPVFPQLIHGLSLVARGIQRQCRHQRSRFRHRRQCRQRRNRPQFQHQHQHHNPRRCRPHRNQRLPLRF